MNKKSFINNDKIYKMALNAMLIAIMIIMAFTPIGYIKVSVIEITLMPIPVVVGAILLGPTSGLLLGTVFGITSFLQCIGIPTLSAFGSALFNINSWYTFFMCMVPRMIMGLLTGLLFKALEKIDKTKFVSYVITCISGALMNTVFFITCLMMFFGTDPFITGLIESMGNNNFFKFVIAFVGLNGLVEIIVCAFTGVAISKVLSVVIAKRNSKKRLT